MQAEIRRFSLDEIDPRLMQSTPTRAVVNRRVTRKAVPYRDQSILVAFLENCFSGVPVRGQVRKLSESARIVHWETLWIAG